MAFIGAMPKTLLRFAVPAVAVAILLGTPLRSRAEDPKPAETAPPFSATYHLQRDVRDDPGAEWTSDRNETVTIAIDGTRSRWDYGGDGTVKIFDTVASTYMVTGGKVGNDVAYRVAMSFRPIGWEFGYAYAASPDGAKVETLGTTKIAGRECTRMRITSEEFGEPEFCVTKNGIVLRFTNSTPEERATYEATSVTDGPVDVNKFSLPPELKIEKLRDLQRR